MLEFAFDPCGRAGRVIAARCAAKQRVAAYLIPSCLGVCWACCSNRRPGPCLVRGRNESTERPSRWSAADGRHSVVPRGNNGGYSACVVTTWMPSSCGPSIRHLAESGRGRPAFRSQRSGLLQAAVDLLTIRENGAWGHQDRVCGGSSNVTNCSWGCGQTSMTITVGCPPGYQPDRHASWI